MIRQLAFRGWAAVRAEQFSAGNVRIKGGECRQAGKLVRGSMDRLPKLVKDVHSGAAFAEKQLDEIIAFAVAGNTRSTAVMRRIGMVAAPERDFMMPGIEDARAEIRPHVVYAISRAAWQTKGR